MIFPINSNFWFLEFDGCALAPRGINVIKVCGAEVAICSRGAFSLAVKTLPDGARLECDFSVGRYRDGAVLSCRVIYQGVARVFDNVSLGEEVGGYLLGRCESKEEVSFAYCYERNIYLELPKESCVFFAAENWVFVKKNIGGVEVVSVLGVDGVLVGGFEYQWSGYIRTAVSAFRVGDNVFINCSGFASGGLLHCFSLSEKKLLPPISLDSYMGAMCNVGDDFFYIDGAFLRHFNSESPCASVILAELPPLLGPKRDSGRGQEWLWWDGTCLYVASQVGGAIWSYDLDGNFLYEQRVPDGWRIWHVKKGHAETGQNIVHLSTTAHEWGFAAVISWLPGDFCNESLMQIEAIEAVEVEQIPGKKGKHGYRMTARDANGEHLARHAMHHFARLANKVAPSTMNGGKVNDKDFDGALELVLEIPQRQALEQVYIDYVIEGCEQMRYPLQSHRAGNKRDPIKLKLFWQAGEGEAMELLYDSEASSA